MNASSPTTVTNTLTTIPTTNGVSSAEAAPEAGSGQSTETNGTHLAAPPADPSGDTNSGEASEPAGGAAPPSEDENLKIARRFESAAKREARARRLETEWQQKMSGISSKQAELDALISQYREALTDPVKHYLDNGGDPVEVAKRIARPESEEAKRIRTLEERLKQQDEEREQQRQRWEQQAAQDRQHKAMREFVGSISSAECPNLTTLHEAQEVPSMVSSLLNRRANPSDPNSPTLLQTFREEHGRSPTNKEIRECLEYEAELRATRILKQYRDREQKLQQQQPAPDASPVSVERPPSPKGPKGISNQHAATTSSGRPRPKSQEERRKAARQELTAALEAEAAERRND